MKIIGANELHTVNPGQKCFIIKNVFAPKQCTVLLEVMPLKYG